MLFKKNQSPYKGQIFDEILPNNIFKAFFQQTV